MRRITTRPIAAEKTATSGSRKKSVPRLVATPLPPEKRRVMGKLWPSTAATATPPRSQPSTPSIRAIQTAIPPLKMSKSATKIAGPQPRTRWTLVAPMLPEPTLRRSTR